ncbi:MAG: hypothetical protein J3Q66DRAFT_352675 [Benniella sp.]|nr:MAG: hypothetical protein J3Q66DRAFT_352675 [Benniella sp.]
MSHTLSIEGMSQPIMSLYSSRLCGCSIYSQHHFKIPRCLSLDRIDVRSQDNNMVWNLVSRLESLEIRRSTMPGLPKSLTGSWRMKELTLDSENDLAIKEQMRWMERCRHLKRLTWIPLYVSRGAAVEELTQSIAANTWPELEEFYSPNMKGSDQQLSFVIGRMRRVPALSINCDEPLDLVKTALWPHFAWLTKLEVTTTSGDNALFTLEVLKSCPKLQSLKMGTVPVQVRDMLNDDAPWVCEDSLKHLAVCFNVEEDISKAGQRILFERLSRLHKLEQLDLSCKPPVQSLDLRLEAGLEQLATLTRLEELTFRGTVQKMKVKDAEWMIEHWKSLKSVKGRMHSEDADEWGRMVTMLYGSRIACNPWDV